jgi:hypothetical protein
MTPLHSPYDLRKKLEIYGIVLLILTAISFGVWKAYPLILGPTITIYNPQDGDTVKRTTFEISGQVSRVKEITLQGRPIPIGTDGHFTEILIAQDPYTIIVVTATDFYGKTITKTLRVAPEK